MQIDQFKKAMAYRYQIMRDYELSENENKMTPKFRKIAETKKQEPVKLSQIRSLFEK